MDEQPSVGRFRVQARIGTGGMGEVYLASAPGPRGVAKNVALKLIRGLYQEDREFLDMFMEEAKVSFLLTHPNIVQTYEIGQVDGHYFLVMEYVDGITLGLLLHYLRDKLKQPLPLPYAIYVASQVTRGLDYAHTLTAQDGRPLGIVHRDISPSNVLLSRDGQVKVTDFGLAISALREIESQSGQVKGKAPYMPIEQLEGKRVDARADLFAVGVMLYEMLSGRSPFGERKEITITSRLLNRGWTPLAEAAPHLEPALIEVVERCLAEAPDARFPSARELGRQLDAILRDRRLAVSNYELADFIAQARSAAEVTPQAPHPFDRALGMEIQRVVGPDGAPRYVTVPPVMPGPIAVPAEPASPEAVTQSDPPPAPETKAAESAGLARLTQAVTEPSPLSQRLSPADAPPPVDLAAIASRPTAPPAGSEVLSSSLVRPPRSHTGLLVALIVVGLGAAAGAAIYLGGRGPRGDQAAGTPLTRPDQGPRAAASGSRRDAAASRLAAVEVRPTPEGGRVLVDGVDRGAAPVTLAGLDPAHPIEVRVLLAGHRPHRETVVLQAGASLVLRPRLVPDSKRPAKTRPEPRGVGRLSVNSEPWSDVYVDGKLIQSTPLVGHQLPAGPHRVLLLNPKRHLRSERRVTIEPDRETQLSVELK